MNVSEYIAQFLADHAVDHVFMITGGGAMFLNDAIGHQKGIRCIFNHHEQSSAMAAEAYARVSGKPGVINVTTGPGGINAMNGVFGAWTDSIPMIVISGQIKRETCMAYYPELKVRQIGDQEVDIISMVKSITKYAVLLEDAQFVRYQMEKLWYMALNGRPGPCWIDIPTDVQSAQVDPDRLIPYLPLPVHQKLKGIPASEICALLRKAKKPVLMIGNGAREAVLSGSLYQLIKKLRIPVVTSWSGLDLIESDHACFAGRAGTVGQRAGNIVIQEADFVIALGTRLNIRQISYNWENFAKHAFVVQIDVDGGELIKPTSSSDWRVQCGSDTFCSQMIGVLKTQGAFPVWDHWLAWCKSLQTKYPPVTVEMKKKTGKLNPYVFLERLFRRAPEGSIFACGNGAACVMSIQTAVIKKGTRMFTNSGDASMGYDLPAAIGAAFAAAGSQRPVICLAGDGSMMMNLQELQTIAQYQLPVRIVVLKNNGYLSIHQSQKSFFGRFIGEGPESGITFPDYGALARAFGIADLRLTRENYEEHMSEIFTGKTPLLVEVELDSDQWFEPKLGSRKNADGSMTSCSLEDMSPLLSAEELEQNHFNGQEKSL